MSDLYIYFSLALLVLLFLLSSVIYKKFKIWKILIILITVIVYGVIRFLPNLITFITIDEITEYYNYFLYFIVILIAVTFKSKIKITRNLTDYDFFELEKELEDIKDVSDLLRLRFISTIGLLKEGLIFYDPGLSDMFITEKAKEIVKKSNSNITVEDYILNIYNEDQTEYRQIIKKVNRKNPNYEVKYRVKRNNGYIWIEEKGKLFTHNKKDYLVSSIRGIDIKLFPETTIHELDSVPSESKLSQYLVQYKKEKAPYYLVLMHLTNIPDINSRFGRDVGNLMIAEYIKKMRYHFAREYNSLFRITGIQFALIIKDEQKYKILKRALVSGGDLINLKLNIGGIQQLVYPNIGIVRCDPWSNYETNDLMVLAQKTLEEAIRNNKKNYSIFGE